MKKSFPLVFLMLSAILLCFMSSCKTKVEPLVELTGITLNTDTMKTEYFQSEKLNLSGLKVFANYSDGSEEEVKDYITSMKTGDPFPECGKIKITVTYEEKTASFEIDVNKNYLSLISITLPEYTDAENLLSEDNGIFIASTEYESYEWWIDGEPTTIILNTYTPDQDSLNDGYHELMLIVKTEDNKTYSALASFLIKK